MFEKATTLNSRFTVKFNAAVITSSRLSGVRYSGLSIDVTEVAIRAMPKLSRLAAQTI